jgi:hypothetical protein
MNGMAFQAAELGRKAIPQGLKSLSENCGSRSESRRDG